MSFVNKIVAASSKLEKETEKLLKEFEYAAKKLGYWENEGTSEQVTEFKRKFNESKRNLIKHLMAK